jgi:hypothetical protein
MLYDGNQLRESLVVLMNTVSKLGEQMVEMV